jgi:integrase
MTQSGPHTNAYGRDGGSSLPDRYGWDQQLESITPEEAVDWYLDHRRDDARTSTRRKHRYALEAFLDWADEVELEDMTELGGRHLMQFKTWRKRDGDLAKISLNGNLAILCRFLTFCENIEAVQPGMADRVPMPNVPEQDQVSDVTPSDEAVEGIRTYYRKYEYASRRQAIFELIAEVGLRMGAIRAIDLEDFDAGAQLIDLHHRPESPDERGTPLKNGQDGERLVNLSPGLCELLEDYIAGNRHDVTDEYGRDPLFTTSNGRVSTGTIRKGFYRMTRPCKYSDACPDDRSISDCEAAQSAHASKCPAGFTTHPLRRWSIMHQLDQGVRKELLSDRVDVSVPVLEQHYDQRSEERKRQQRRDVLVQNLDEYDAT